MLNLVQTGAPNAGIRLGGDYNDFYFYRPLTTVTGYTMADGTARVGGARFDNLHPHPRRGRALQLRLRRAQSGDRPYHRQRSDGRDRHYDVVHINTGYNPLGTGADANPALSAIDNAAG